MTRWENEMAMTPEERWTGNVYRLSIQVESGDSQAAWACQECGAVVTDQALHDKFHAIDD